MSLAAGRCHSNTEGFVVDNAFTMMGRVLLQRTLIVYTLTMLYRSILFGGKVGGPDMFSMKGVGPMKKFFDFAIFRWRMRLRLRANRTVRLLKG